MEDLQKIRCYKIGQEERQILDLIEELKPQGVTYKKEDCPYIWLTGAEFRAFEANKATFEMYQRALLADLNKSKSL